MKREFNHMLRRTFGLLALATLAAFPAAAQEIKAGDLVIAQAWSRATPKGSPVGAGYLTIRNNGAAPDRLVAVETEAAKVAQVHEMSMDGGVMKMRQLTNGLDIPAGKTVELKPGGFHIMLMELARPFAQGDSYKITLVFERAGRTTVDVKVGGMGDMAAPMNHDAMHMNH
jgi:copper(I)-binding protein